MMMCRALTDKGFEVHLATLPTGDDVPMPGLVMHRVSRLPFIENIPVGFSIGKLFYNVLLVYHVSRLLRSDRFDAVHAIEEAAFYAVPLARRRRVPAMIDLDSDITSQLREHRSPLVKLLAGPAGSLRRMALRRATGALTVAPHISRLVQSESPATAIFEISDVPIEGAGRPPDPAKMEAYRAALGLCERRLVVYTGNCDRRQGLEELIGAMPEVARRHPEVALIVVGGEPADIGKLQTLVEELGIPDVIHLIGKRDPDTMPEYMGMADVLVSPRQERYTTPLKIFSYMASGRPIVATDLPTHSVVLNRDSAVLTPPTAAGLAAGISSTLDDPTGTAKLGANAAQLVRKKYTFENFQHRLIEAYRAIL